MEYAIVDIETTGGYATGSGITEIAIFIHDGFKVIDRYQTLINPQKNIPLSIQAMTGINNEMVADSPLFSEVAGHVYEMLSGRVFVAHNVNFDFSFIKYFLQLEGYDFNPPKLCTVRMSRKICPGFHSYSLGKLCAALDIPINNRHRAGGDAEATAILFSRLLQWDTKGYIAAMLKKGSGEQSLPPNLPRENFNGLPYVPGVYYFRNKAGKPIYVGKAANIHKRVSSHFTGSNPGRQRQQFLRDIYAITYEECGTELMALLLEAIEIKRLWPLHNRAMKRNEPRFGLYVYEDQSGFLQLAVGKLAKNQMPVHTFNYQQDGINRLYKMVRDFQLCPQLCLLGNCTTTYFNFCCAENRENTCLKNMDVETYNQRVLRALDDLKNNLPSFAIVDKGRHADERSCIWVEKGNFCGMGYISHYTDLHTPEQVKEALTPYTGNHYMMQLIYSYAEKYPQKVMRFDVQSVG